MKRLTQSGSHIVALAVGILVVGVVSFAGYTIMQRNDTTETATTPTTHTAASDADLTAAATALDSSSSQVNSSLNDSSLDTDLNNLL